jgi:hypothetical protein
MLGCAENARVVFEPDNLLSDLAAAPTYEQLGYMPVLGQTDRAPAAYDRVWQFAFGGGWPWHRWRSAFVVGRQIRRLPPRMRDPLVTGLMRATSRVRPHPQHVIVKSVNACLAIEWVVARYAPTVVITVRNPMAIVSSWRDLGIIDPDVLTTHPLVRERFVDEYSLPDPPGATADPLLRIAWRVGLQVFALKLACDRHPDWLVVEHEELCADPLGAFRKLYGDLGLVWTQAGDRYLEESNQPGEGFAVLRVAKDAPHRWRSRLNAQESVAVRRVLSAFPLALEAV